MRFKLKNLRLSEAIPFQACGTWLSVWARVGLVIAVAETICQRSTGRVETLDVEICQLIEVGHTLVETSGDRQTVELQFLQPGHILEDCRHRFWRLNIIIRSLTYVTFFYENIWKCRIVHNMYINSYWFLDLSKKTQAIFLTHSRIKKPSRICQLKDNFFLTCSVLC